MSRVDDGGAKLGLRERKKVKLRENIVRCAVELFEQRGFDETSIDEIAERAEISPSTFFRYYATKEEVLLGADAALLQILIGCVSESFGRRPSLNGVMDGFLEFAQRFDGMQDDLSRRRARLLSVSESVQARAAHSQLLWERAVAEELARIDRLSKPELRHEILASTVMGAYSVAVVRWRKQRRERLVELLRAAFAELLGLLGDSDGESARDDAAGG
ncbi:TetR family transcriptional regulator [Mycobacterium vicinigordonae]|uniref:TetR family transcriptional regulator n=1 Tax=Mycobacterium vicinigordonae TaxID=1719132 RepID=A0A7D6HUX2_9MYCO|nr:TetR family transcriptional regulator [Mycobacterium vicinigordonae]QLL07393.1 TetR family transcriptional regulator [Mycobacterium vicinigordonae]